MHAPCPANERLRVLTRQFLVQARTAGDDSLPSGWERQTAADGKVYYVDHNTKTTHWAPPNADGSTSRFGPIPSAADSDGISTFNSHWRREVPVLDSQMAFADTDR